MTTFNKCGPLPCADEIPSRTSDSKQTRYLIICNTKAPHTVQKRTLPCTRASGVLLPGAGTETERQRKSPSAGGHRFTACHARVAWVWGWSGLRPDSQGAERAAILLEAGILVREAHALTGTQLPVAGDLDAGEVDETVARDFRRGNHTPALIGVEPPDHASRTVLRRRMLLSHRPIVSPSLPGSSSSSDSFKPVSESTAHGAGQALPAVEPRPPWGAARGGVSGAHSRLLWCSWAEPVH